MNQLEPVFIPGIFFGGVPLPSYNPPQTAGKLYTLNLFSGRDMNYQYTTETL